MINFTGTAAKMMGYHPKVGVLQPPHLSKGGVLMVELLTHIYTGLPRINPEGFGTSCAYVHKQVN